MLSRFRAWSKEFVKRPLVHTSIAVLLTIGAQVVSERSLVRNALVTVGWAVITVEFYRSLSPASKRIWITAIVGLSLGALMYTVLWKHGSEFLLKYGESKLDGRKIILTRNIDPTKRPVLMHVWPSRQPTYFSTAGLAILNEGKDEALEPDAAYISFESAVSKLYSNSGCWRPSPYFNAESWTTYECQFGKTSVAAGHEIMIEDFFGQPIPTHPLKAKVVVVYGQQKMKADFTIYPPQ